MEIYMTDINIVVQNRATKEIKRMIPLSLELEDFLLIEVPDGMTTTILKKILVFVGSEKNKEVIYGG